MSGEQLEAACERTHETAAPPRTNGDSARNTSTAPYKARAVCEPRAPPHPTRKRSKRSNGAPRNGKICAPCMIRGVRAAKAAPSWQDLRAVRSRKAVCGLFRCMARISCQSQLVLDAWRANLATNWRFSRPRRLLGYMKRKTCHGLPPENAPGRNIVTARRLGTHQSTISPSPGT